jgi:hypothetical protein
MPIEVNLLKDDINLKAFESLLKKCPNIKTIILAKNYFNRMNYWQTILMISKYCHNLCRIGSGFQDMSLNTFKKFSKKFENQLIFYKIYGNEVFTRLKTFTNIQELSIGWTQDLTINFMTDIELKNLNKLEILCSEGHEDSLGIFFERHKNIRHLSLTSCSPHLQKVDQLLNQTSRLKNLIEFDFWCNYGLNNKFFAHSLHRMAHNCSQLKSFGCHLTFNSENVLKFSKLLSNFKGFKQLKRMRHHFESPSSELDSTLESNKFFFFKAFKGFESITHLTVCVNPSNLVFNDSFLTDIDKNLPKLRYLLIDNELKATQRTA